MKRLLRDDRGRLAGKLKMKRARYIVTLLGFATVFSPAHSAVSRVQTAIAHGGGSTTKTATFSMAVASHDLIAIGVISDTSTAAPTALACSTSETINTAQAWGNGGTGSRYMEVVYIKNTVGGASVSCTVTFAAAADIELGLIDYAGADETTPFSATAGFTNTSSGTPITSGALSYGSGDEAVALESGGNLGSWDNGFAAAITEEASSPGLHFGDQTMTGTGTIAANFNSSVGGSKIITEVVFKAAAAGSTCTHTAWLQNGTVAVPTAGGTIVWRQDGSFGTVDCSSVDYWQPDVGNFGLN